MTNQKSALSLLVSLKKTLLLWAAKSGKWKRTASTAVELTQGEKKEGGGEEDKGGEGEGEDKGEEEGEGVNSLAYHVWGTSPRPLPSEDAQVRKTNFFAFLYLQLSF